MVEEAEKVMSAASAMGVRVFSREEGTRWGFWGLREDGEWDVAVCVRSAGLFVVIGEEEDGEGLEVELRSREHIGIGEVTSRTMHVTLGEAPVVWLSTLQQQVNAERGVEEDSD